MYERLGSDQAKVLTGRDIVDIISSNSGVTVKCADGTIYEGSIVVGADGVHSTVRSIMRRMALEEDSTRSWDAENPSLTTYKCLWFSTPSLLSEQDFSGYLDMTVNETYHKDHSIMCFEREAALLNLSLQKVAAADDATPHLYQGGYGRNGEYVC